MQYTIHKAKPADANGMAEVHVQSWRETYVGIIDDEYLNSLSVSDRTAKWKKNLENQKKNVWIFVAKDATGKIVGFISGGEARDFREIYAGELYAIYILKEVQGGKIGINLTKKLVEQLRQHAVLNMYVCVLKNNNSKFFYIKYGGKLFKTIFTDIGKQSLEEEYYGWDNFDSFV